MQMGTAIIQGNAGVGAWACKQKGTMTAKEYTRAFRRVLALRRAVLKYAENDTEKAAVFLHRLKLAEMYEAELFTQIKG